MKITLSFFIKSISFWGIVLLNGCEDVLPTYQEPVNIFSVNINIADIDSGEVIFWLNSDEKKVLSQSLVPFRYNVRNIYEETIQGMASIKGRVEIWPTSNPDSKATSEITFENLLSFQNYDSHSGILTINPSQLVWFTGDLKLVMDNGFCLKDYTKEKSRIIAVEFGNPIYDVTYYPLPVTIRVTIQLFDKAAPVYADTIFNLQLHGKIPIPR